MGDLRRWGVVLVFAAAAALIVGCGPEVYRGPTGGTSSRTPSVTGPSLQVPAEEGQWTQLTSTDWVTSADGALSLRLSASANDVRSDRAIRLWAQLRNNTDEPLNVVRPFGDDYDALGRLIISSPDGPIHYTGDE